MTGPRAVVRAVQNIKHQSGRSWSQVIRLFIQLVKRIMGNPQVSELVRFIFLGTIVETGRVIGARMVSTVNSFFLVQASFKQGE
ncbi:hypothetical protein FB45DRAFT_1065212, partial [Roridomyces roridus]